MRLSQFICFTALSVLLKINYVASQVQQVSAIQRSVNAKARVAFSAGLCKLIYVYNDEVVLYDYVYTNVGNGFNQSTGIFTSPVAGTYIFYISLQSQESKASHLQLFQNLQVRISIYENDAGRYPGTANSVILHLHKIDEICVKSLETSHLYGLPHEVYTIFSGHLIYAD